MPRKKIPMPAWFPQACELMAKYDLSLLQAAEELGQNVSVEEAAALQDRKPFKEALEEARLANYVEIGSNPRLCKEAVVGMLYKFAERLSADGEDYKAADAVLKLAKVKGIIGAEPDSLWKTFSTFSQADIDGIKKRLNEQTQEQWQQSAAKPEDDGAKTLN